jgi:hypothetical protein
MRVSALLSRKAVPHGVGFRLQETSLLTHSESPVLVPFSKYTKYFPHYSH